MSNETTTKDTSTKDHVEEVVDIQNLNKLFMNALNELGISEADFYKSESGSVNQTASALAPLLSEDLGEEITFNECRSFLRDIGYRAARNIRNLRQAKMLFKHWDKVSEAALYKDAASSMRRRLL